MHHFRVLLDLDGTVAQNAGRQLAARQFGITINEEDYGESLSQLLGLTDQQFWAWWHENQEEIYRLARPIAGAADVLQALKGAGAYIAVVTARRSSARQVTEEWLANNGIAYDHMEMDADNKVTIASRLRLNVGFEDDPYHALPLADLLPMALMDNFKNRGRTIDHPAVYRMAGWQEVLPWLNRLAARTA